MIIKRNSPIIPKIIVSTLQYRNEQTAIPKNETMTHTNSFLFVDFKTLFILINIKGAMAHIGPQNNVKPVSEPAQQHKPSPIGNKPHPKSCLSPRITANTHTIMHNIIKMHETNQGKNH